MPPKRVLPNPDTCTLKEFETTLHCAPYQRSFIRLLAIKELLFGMEFENVARMHSISKRTLSRWIAAYNREGVNAFLDKKIPGRPKKLQGEKAEQYLDLLESPQKAGPQHWTGKKFHGYLHKNSLMSKSAIVL